MTAAKIKTAELIAQAVELHARGLKLYQIAAIMGVQRPCITRRLQIAGVLPPPQPTRNGCGRPRNIPEPKHGAEPVIVYRDPCPRCGTRSDFGCRHAPSNGITGWVLR